MWGTSENLPAYRKLICKSCGAPLYRRVTGKGICWICKNHVYHFERCTEKGYSETAVLQEARCLCRKLRTYSKELLQWYLQTLLKIESHDRACRPQVQDLYQTINDILIQSHTLQRLYASGCIDSGFFISRKNELDHQLADNKARLHEAKATLCGDIIRQTRIMMDALGQDATPTDEVIWGQLIVKATVGEGRISFSMLNGLELTSPLRKKADYGKKAAFPIWLRDARGTHCSKSRGSQAVVGYLSKLCIRRYNTSHFQ